MMKPLSGKRLPATIVALPLSTAAAAYTDEAVWQPVPDGQGNGLFYNNHDVPPGYYPLLLLLGRSVYADLQRARQAALDRQATKRSEPDWTGALETVQSALSTFHWFTGEPAQGLLSACNDVINAYITTGGTDSRPEQKRQVTRYLESAERRLAAEPGGKQLASEASKLAQMTAPPGTDMKTLIGNIRSEIRLQQLNAEHRYWYSHKHNEVQ